LKTVDIDARSEYSNVIRINNNSRNVNVLSVMPNPFESNIRLQVYANKSFPATIRIADLTGREMFRTSAIITAGNNNISLNLPVSLSKGMYLLQLISNNEVIWKQKIEKIK
jgi:Secretion system C-terminal sorting domain